MSDLAQTRIAEGKFICNILPQKKLSRSQQHLMTEAPTRLGCEARWSVAAFGWSRYLLSRSVPGRSEKDGHSIADLTYGELLLASYSPAIAHLGEVPALFVSGSLDRTAGRSPTMEGDRSVVPLTMRVLRSGGNRFVALRKAIPARPPSYEELSAVDHREAGRIMGM
jgi:hypothetical protein